jgi:hypothetical protein
MLLEAYYLGRTIAPSTPEPRPRARRGAHGAALRRDELAVLQFLQEELSS